MKMDDDKWEIVIKPKNNWFDLQLGEIWQYRDLVLMFVQRNFVTVYKQTILGPFWYLILPVFTTIVFTIVFGKVAQIPTDNVPPFLFYMAGNIIWNYFITCFSATSTTFLSNANLFGKVYFPRLIVPISTVISNLLLLAIQFALFLSFYFYFLWKGAPMEPNRWILCFPILILQMAFLSVGVGILVSSLTTKYRDLTIALGPIIQLWMYASPIVYPFSSVPDWLKPWYALNPMVSIVESFRFSFFGVGGVGLDYMIGSWAITFLLGGAGLVLFTRAEKTFMDTV